MSICQYQNFCCYCTQIEIKSTIAMMPESITDFKKYSLGQKWTLIALQHRLHKSLATERTIHDLFYLLRPNATFLRKALKCKLVSYLENGKKLA